MNDLIRDMERIKQVVDFSGLYFGEGKYPTDIDAFYDLGGELFIFIEAKLEGVSLPIGQKLGFGRLTDTCNKGGVKTIYLVAQHNTPKNQSIDLAAAMVVMFRSKGMIWKPPIINRTVREAMLEIIAWHEKEKHENNS